MFNIPLKFGVSIPQERIDYLSTRREEISIISLLKIQSILLEMVCKGIDLKDSDVDYVVDRVKESSRIGELHGSTI